MIVPGRNGEKETHSRKLVVKMIYDTQWMNKKNWTLKFMKTNREQEVFLTVQKNKQLSNLDTLI